MFIKSSSKCCLPTCSSSSPRQLFKFPTSEARGKKWLRALKFSFPSEFNYDEFAKQLRICREHFENKYLYKTRNRSNFNLFKHAVPTINLPEVNNSENSNENDITTSKHKDNQVFVENITDDTLPRVLEKNTDDSQHSFENRCLADISNSRGNDVNSQLNMQKTGNIVEKYSFLGNMIVTDHDNSFKSFYTHQVHQSHINLQSKKDEGVLKKNYCISNGGPAKNNSATKPSQKVKFISNQIETFEKSIDPISRTAIVKDVASSANDAKIHLDTKNIQRSKISKYSQKEIILYKKLLEARKEIRRLERIVKRYKDKSLHLKN